MDLQKLQINAPHLEAIRSTHRRFHQMSSQIFFLKVFQNMHLQQLFLFKKSKWGSFLMSFQ